MEQLEKFIALLRMHGFDAVCINQIKNGRGFIEFWTISRNGKYASVVFELYGQKQGYQMYIQSSGNTFDDDLLSLANRLTK